VTIQGHRSTHNGTSLLFKSAFRLQGIADRHVCQMSKSAKDSQVPSTIRRPSTSCFAEFLLTNNVTCVTLLTQVTERRPIDEKYNTEDRRDICTAGVFAGARNVGYLKQVTGRFTQQSDNFFAAITFAEAGEFDTAKAFIGRDSGDCRRPVGSCLPGCWVGKA
jgi:hypothetical protein